MKKKLFLVLPIVAATLFSTVALDMGSDCNAVENENFNASKVSAKRAPEMKKTGISFSDEIVKKSGLEKECFNEYCSECAESEMESPYIEDISSDKEYGYFLSNNEILEEKKNIDFSYPNQKNDLSFGNDKGSFLNSGLDGKLTGALLGNEHKYAFQHVYDGECVSLNTIYHTIACKCGATKKEVHNLSYKQSLTGRAIKHILYCKDCDFSTSEFHSYNENPVSVSFGEHVVYCKCGQKITEPHEFVTTFDTESCKRIETCKVCGYSHTHDYTDHYEFYGKTGTNHKSYCKCGEYIISSCETVRVKPIMVNDEFHIDEKCLKCGIQGTSRHTYTYKLIVSPDGKTHKAYCECGAFIIQEHEYKVRGEYINQNTHRVYCECGVSVLETHNDPNNWEDIDESRHGIFCSDCGWRYEAHTYDTVGDYYAEGKHKINCKCGRFILADCDFTYRYEKCAGTGHYEYCECGNFITKPCNKDGGVVKSDWDGHVTKCSICGSETRHGHNFTGDLTNITERSHYDYCSVCEKSYEQAHKCVFENKPGDISDETHICRCACGITEIYRHHYEIEIDDNGNAVEKCTTCGHIKNEQ